MNLITHLTVLVVLWCCISGVHGLSAKTPNTINQQSKPAATRRTFLTQIGQASAAAAAVFIADGKKSIAGAESYGDNSVLNDGSAFDSPERRSLLEAIASRSSDDVVADAINRLEKLDPSGGKAATSTDLGGTWELIYSVNAEAFSPLLNLPQPIRPTSLQLLGKDAAQSVGEGRVAQVLNFPIVPLSLVLSSGAVPVPSDPSILEIYPPFRLEAVVATNNRFQFVESGSDADFRGLNGRDDEAQAAGRNLYKQRYLETSGKKGDLRISEIIAGDPVIVGEIFVHRRL
eukprot:CAMPEP_0116042712 /NCGR_PEP_ID=MMETSP0321-20121206/25871_1 /TAXON_ID=163516 /ORGANISM="Leptocylindrus danicus var. danicus, Strain B650" /LENGTH=287 /DNA_ID=CAMNT_0003523277 /DNA_START=108 /DNA_END=971 /DNA_ORIENTATION=-